MLSFVTQMFSGHLGALELAGASIANVGIQGLAYGIMVCLVFVTLCDIQMKILILVEVYS